MEIMVPGVGVEPHGVVRSGPEKDTDLLIVDDKEFRVKNIR